MKENLSLYSILNHSILRIIPASILLILLVVNSNAQDADYTWHLVAFENEKEVAFYNTEVITGIGTTAQNVTVVMDNGIEFSHLIATATFGFDPRNEGTGTANETVVTPKWNVGYDGGRLRFSERVNGVAVYTLYGALIVRFGGNHTEVPVNLRQGIYVLHAGGKSAKLIVGMCGNGYATQTATHGLQIRASEVRASLRAGDGIKTRCNVTAGNETVSFEMSDVERFHFKTGQSIVFFLKNGNTVELDDYKEMTFDVEPAEKPDDGKDGNPWTATGFTQADVNDLKLRKVYFGHKSVGGNIVAGIKRLSNIDMRTAYNQPDRNDQSLRTAIEQLAGGPAFVEHDIGSDGLPFNKIASFERFMNDIIRDNVEIAFFKFCYMDIDARTDINALITAYKEAMDRLHVRFPNVIIAHITVPLYSRAASFDNRLREQFSDWLRETYNGLVFDLAVIESVDSGGKTALSHDNVTIAMADEWTDDGGHLNEAGQNRIAGALIAFLAQLK